MRRGDARRLRISVADAEQEHYDICPSHTRQARLLGRFGGGAEVLRSFDLVAEQSSHLSCGVPKRLKSSDDRTDEDLHRPEYTRVRHRIRGRGHRDRGRSSAGSPLPPPTSGPAHSTRPNLPQVRTPIGPPSAPGNRIHRLASTKPTGVPWARRQHARSTWGSRPPRGLPSDYRPSPKPRHDPGAGDSDAPHLVYRLSAARIPYLGYRTCSPSLTNSGSSSPSATRRTASRRTRRSRS